MGNKNKIVKNCRDKCYCIRLSSSDSQKVTGAHVELLRWHHILPTATQSYLELSFNCSQNPLGMCSICATNQIRRKKNTFSHSKTMRTTMTPMTTLVWSRWQWFTQNFMINDDMDCMNSTQIKCVRLQGSFATYELITWMRYRSKCLWIRMWKWLDRIR